MAFQTSLSGLNAAQTNLSVTGNNIANASTNGFKRSRAEFADIYATNFSSMSQVGSGVRVANIGQQFAQGNIEFTDNSLDLSISGDGFFILRDESGEQYTRAGAYQVDRDGFIVNSRGQRLQGYSPTMGDLFIDNAPSPANATTSTDINLNLDAYARSPIINGTGAGYTTGNIDVTNLDYSGAATETSSGPGTGVTNEWESNGDNQNFTLSIDGVEVLNVTQSEGELETIDAAMLDTAIAAFIAASGGAYEQDGTLAGGDLVIRKMDGSDMDIAVVSDFGTPGAFDQAGFVANHTDGTVSNNATMIVTAGGTGYNILINQDFSNDLVGLAAFIQDSLLPDQPFTVEAVGDTLVFTSNVAGAGAFSVSSNDTELNDAIDAGGAVAGTASVLFDRTDPNTYNFSTSTTIFDSLGRGHTQTIYFVKDNDETNAWTSYVYVGNEPIPASTIGSTLAEGRPLVYTTGGQLLPGTGEINYGTFTPVPGLDGAEADPIEVIVDYTGSTQYAGQSSVNGIYQDGYTSGRINGISIDDGGVIFARYTNGQSVSLGTVALARFENPNGLQPIGDTNWVLTYQAGEMLAGIPGTGSLGRIEAGALEASNVDISIQLVNMIIAQRDFQANAKMISTEDQITQTIINIR